MATPDDIAGVAISLASLGIMAGGLAGVTKITSRALDMMDEKPRRQRRRKH